MEHFPQQPVVPNSEHVSFQEKMKQEITQKIQAAINNPISEERIEAIDNELQQIKVAFVESKTKDEITKLREKEIEEELLKSSVHVKTIAEFREVLIQLGERFGRSHDWIGKYLAHENAHANVSEQANYDQGGYAAIFIKDKNGTLAGIQPLFIGHSSPQWGPEELLLKENESLKAPEVYGDALSDSDKQDIAFNEELLKKHF